MELLSSANWSASMDFELTYEELNPEMMTWLRLILATPEELMAAKSHEAFAVEASTNTEGRAMNALLVTLENTLGKYDYSIEEDEAILDARARNRKPLAQPDSAPHTKADARAELAVRYRRLCKKVLLRNQQLASDAYHTGARRRRRASQLPSPIPKAPPAVVSSTVSATGVVEEKPGSLRGDVASGVGEAGVAADEVGGKKKKPKKKRKKKQEQKQA